MTPRMQMLSAPLVQADCVTVSQLAALRASFGGRHQRARQVTRSLTRSPRLRAVKLFLITSY